MAREHGTISCYKAGCRCGECAQACREYDREIRRRLARGLPTTDLVDAEPARRHARRLMQLGWRHVDIAAESRTTHIITLLYGKPSKGVAPLRRISALYSRRILALPARMRPTGSTIDPSGSRRRMQALCAIGYPVVWQAQQMGLTRSLVSRLVNGASGGILARHAVAIRDLYEDLWDKPAAASRQVSLALSTARSKGYLPPMAWDDDLIDLPEEELRAELSRRVAFMDSREVRRCFEAHRAGDRSPLIVAAAAVWPRRKWEDERDRKAAA